MSANFNKNGVINCTPIDGFDKVSIMKNKYIQEFSNYNNWENGHWWGNSTESGFRRTTITKIIKTFISKIIITQSKFYTKSRHFIIK